jgi:hypothetical protein
MSCPDVSAFTKHSVWVRHLQAAAQESLTFCPNFPEIAARHEAWWHCAQSDGALLLASVNRDPKRPLSRHLDLLGDPPSWLEARRPGIGQTAFSPDWFPFLRADFGPVMLGGLLGAPVEFVSDTTWTRHFITDDWSNAPDWIIHADNPWRIYLPALLKMLAQDASGQYVACTPSLGGSADVLLNMRGPDALCLDLLDQRNTVRAAIDTIYLAWRESFQLIWDTVCSREIDNHPPTGLINWVGLWSNQPYHVLECDFNYLIGPREFEDIFLPDIDRQARDVGRGIFHLDGPGATRHIDALLELESLQAIQYVAGAGHRARSFLPMLRKIQKKGKALQIACDRDEVLELAHELKPAGLAFLTVFDREGEMLQVRKELQTRI